MKVPAILVLSLIILCAIPHAAGETGGVQVENVSPWFSDISLNEDGEYSIISVNITDYNSYEDLKWVYVNVTHGERLISSMAYMAGEEGNRTGDLSNLVGEHLIHDNSMIVHSNETTGLESCSLILEFYFKPINGGDRVEITASDMTGASASHIVNYVYPIQSDGASAVVLTMVLIVSLTLAIVIQFMRKRRYEHEV